LEDGRPHLAVSTAKRVVPKVLRLTWNGYPIHHHKTEKWGYLVPTKDARTILDQVETGDIVTDFPLREYLHFLSTGRTEEGPCPEYTELFIDQLPDYSDAGLLRDDRSRQQQQQSPPAKDGQHETPGQDIGLPGVRFHKLPHKNGARFRVGNPLGKDFLAACGEGGALASKRRELAGSLLRLSMQLAYWRSVRDRLAEQMFVELPHDQLPRQLTQHPDYSPHERYGAILPALVVSGDGQKQKVDLSRVVDPD
jgi:DNA polymerase gamma 1